MTTTIDQRQFISSIIPESALDDAVSWIGNNLQVDEVFSFEVLKEWAMNNGFACGE